MTLRARLALALAALAASSLAHAASSPLRPRNLIDAAEEEYDFVIVGAGQAGLVLGARLTERTNHKVLVLEAGGDGSSGDLAERIRTPGDTFYRSLTTTAYGWNYTTTYQPNIQKNVQWPRGRGLGGTSAINALYMIRPSEIEVNAWHDVLGDLDGADNWTWDSLYTAMKKSETFHAPSDSFVQKAGLKWDADSHGTSGPIHVGYPGYMFDQVGLWTQSVANTGAALSEDTYAGQSWGTAVSMSSINPSNWTRSYSRTGYLDALPPRQLYHVVINAQVTRIIWDDASPADNKKATAIEYTRDGGLTTSRVKILQEAILSAGVVGSPSILMHSGVGPRDVLEPLGVPVTIELPGVGQHLQDHIAVGVEWSTAENTMENLRFGGGPEATDPAYLSYVNDATSYINLTALFNFIGGPEDAVNGYSDFVLTQWENSTVNVPSKDPTVLAGNHAIYNMVADNFFRGPVPVVELLLGLNGKNAVRTQAALQHPLSFGRLYINSTNPLDAPIIDPGYLSSTVDVNILRDTLKFIRRVGQTAPLNATLIAETSPGPAVQTDEQWEQYARDAAWTQFHPSSSCAMLPRNLGGVVDAQLRLYGASNVRVIDSSVFPVAWAAHLMTQTYGLAEQGSTIILKQHGVGEPRPGGTTDSDGAAGVDRPVLFAIAVVAVLAFSLV